MDKKGKIVVIATVAAITIAICFSQSVLREVYRSVVELLSQSSSPSSIVLMPYSTHLEQTGNDIFTKHWLQTIASRRSYNRCGSYKTTASSQPLQANQPVEHDVAKWDIKVVP